MIPIPRSLSGLVVCGTVAMLAGCATIGSFARLDANHDGSGSRAEFDSFMKQEVFTRVDANRDATVSLTEWQNVNPQVDKSRFRKADRNRDGSISRAEAAAFRDSIRHQPGTSPVEKISKASRS